jgi:uncharacterized damage-inducible protein DinB
LDRAGAGGPRPIIIPLDPRIAMSTTTPSVRRLALADLEHEMAQTRRVLERVPDEHFDWKPHARSMSLGRLAAHVANLPWLAGAALQGDELDVAAIPRPDPASAPKSRDQILAKFDTETANLSAALDASDDATLMEKWTMRNGSRVVLSLPRVGAIRGMGISHIVHHRAQLTVYLRLLDVPVPGLYGPSADEQ